MTQVTVAARMGTSQSAIARAEGEDGPTPTVAFLERYAAAVGRSLAPVIVPPNLPPPTREELRRLSYSITDLATRLGFKRIRVVGSVARGDARPSSDVDFVVSATNALRGASYFEAMDRLRQGIERIVGRNVDIIDLDAVTDVSQRRRLQHEARVF